jgi:hypothetical protein
MSVQTRYQFFDMNGHRQSISFDTRAERRMAHVHLQTLKDQLRYGGAVPAITEKWLAGLSNRQYSRLSKTGLVKPRRNWLVQPWEFHN